MTSIAPTTTDAKDIEIALMVEWSDGKPEFIPVVSVEHAERMANTLYAHRPTWTVGREVQPWRYVRRDAQVVLLTAEVSS